jgi:uncharacterized MnhB-related membrane protein
MLQLFDLLLIGMMVWLAWRATNDRDLFRGVVQFIALGLVLAIAWVRLQAPDLALAEAAIGSGVTGALLLAALVRMRRRERASGRPPVEGGSSEGRL